jgi:uncharacterized membrane protein YbhN (UPF0104 family)
MRRLAAILTLLSPVLLPGLARACAVCGGGNPANRLAFFLSTIALSLIPLALFAAGVLWLRSSLKDRLRDEFRDRDAAADTTSPPQA